MLKEALRNLAKAPPAEVQEEQFFMILVAVSHSLQLLEAVDAEEVAWTWTLGHLSRKVAALTSSLGTSWEMARETGHSLVSLVRKVGPCAQVECLLTSVKVAPPLVPRSAGLDLPGMCAGPTTLMRVLSRAFRLA